MATAAAARQNAKLFVSEGKTIPDEKWKQALSSERLNQRERKAIEFLRDRGRIKHHEKTQLDFFSCDLRTFNEKSERYGFGIRLNTVDGVIVPTEC
ncbi:MAG TPA: hypothetical protein VMA75_05170 [Candidatus Paceibacterota bacterium]|nr:hypothetical protein [Candidatus Paceibacterota bacterium]